MKFYISALVGVIIKVILQNARCNNKEHFFRLFQIISHNVIGSFLGNSPASEF